MLAGVFGTSSCGERDMQVNTSNNLEFGAESPVGVH